MSKDLYGNFELVRSLLCFVSLVLRVSNVLFIQSDGSPHTTCYSKLCLGFWAMTCTKWLLVTLFWHVKMLLFSGFFSSSFCHSFWALFSCFCVILYLFFTHGSSCPLNPPKKNPRSPPKLGQKQWFLVIQWLSCQGVYIKKRVLAVIIEKN